MSWQPIETAPKDGYFLFHEDGAIRAKLLIDGKFHSVAYPAIVTAPWGDVVVGEDAGRLLPSGCTLAIRDGCCENPTHWMPLPKPPKADE